MKPQNRSSLIIAILIPLAVGSFSALISGNMSLYSTINKPAFSPPSIVFPIVWTILYVLMGISSYIIYSSDSADKTKALKIYALRYQLYLFSFLWLVILIVLICIMIKDFYKINPAAAYLQIPYLLWCIFAAYLNFSIYTMN